MLTHHSMQDRQFVGAEADITRQTDII